MMRVRVGAASLLGAVALASVVVPSAAANTAPVGSLTLGIRSQITGTVRQVTLTCEPTGGTHPDGQAACADLIAANGDIAAIPPVSRDCPAYDPVIVSATGTWAGQPDGYTSKFQSWCTANATTGGHVFNF